MKNLVRIKKIKWKNVTNVIELFLLIDCKNTQKFVKEKLKNNQQKKIKFKTLKNLKKQKKILNGNNNIKILWRL